MNISRVISGVHWPLDIVVWTIVGLTSGYIICKKLHNNKYLNNLSEILIKISKFFRL
jgi:membrane-associated phospholipid phosphatase